MDNDYNNYASIDNNGYLTVSEWESGALTIIATLVDYPTVSDSIVLYDA